MKKNFIVTFLLGSMLMLPQLLTAQTERDTSFALLFHVKMAKAVSTGIFNPDSDLVYAVSEPGFGTLLLARGTDDIYDGQLGTGLDSGKTYTFRFRINDTLYENVTRNITVNQGTTEYTAWWNDEPANFTTFNVDMSYMVQWGYFNPETDSLDITGTMNEWGGSPLMERVDSSYIYRLTLSLEGGVTYQYRYRINRDTTREEFMNASPRYFRAPDTTIALNQYFNDINPGAVAVNFNCDMRYYANTGRFDPETQYLDIAGSFNDGGAYDLLYQKDGDSVYRTTIFFDTTLLTGDPITFKFRINGDWDLAELQGLPDRSFTIQYPAPVANTYSCWYNDWDPSIPTPPWAYNIAIQGTLIDESTVTGIYTYEDINGDLEGSSIYQWYTADSLGAALVAIDSAWTINYTIDSLDIGKYLVFEITPVALTGDTTVGETHQVWSDFAIGGVGIAEKEPLNVRFYPNPVEDKLTVESQEKELSLVIMDMTGKTLLSENSDAPGRLTLSLERLCPGVYVLYMRGEGNRYSTAKLIRK